MDIVTSDECTHPDATLLVRTVQLRRGDRVAEARRWYRRCERCRDPSGFLDG